MSCSRRETRSEATTRVTCAAIAWLWDRRSRIIVPEVGLTRGQGRLVEPWGSWYRVDLAAVVRGETHIVEVKGTRADIAREDLGSGKWSQPLPELRPWLAFDDKITDDLYADLPGHWGLLRVTKNKTQVLREPHRARDTRPEDSLRILASVLCMQSLPTMMGRTRAQRIAALADDGVDRPWRRWLSEDETTIEEPGHML